MARPNPTDRGKTGWKWSIATDANGVPLGWVSAGANRNDCVLLPGTLDAVGERGLLEEIETLHLDRGYDNGVVRRACAERDIDDLVMANCRARGTAEAPKRIPLGKPGATSGPAHLGPSTTESREQHVTEA